MEVVNKLLTFSNLSNNNILMNPQHLITIITFDSHTTNIITSLWKFVYRIF